MFRDYKASRIIPASISTFTMTITVVCVPMQIVYADHVERVSVNSSEQQANNWSFFCDISGDGQIVAFESDATNLVDFDSNNRSDIFVRNRVAGETTRVSVSSAGLQTNSDSYKPGVSADGRFIVFESNADNLIDEVPDQLTDVFIHDRLTSQTRMVSRDLNDVDSGNNNSFDPVVSADGRYIAFESFASNLVSIDVNNTNDIFVRDMKTNTTELITRSTDGNQANGVSRNPSISSDGRFVAFSSFASNLVTPDNNSRWDIFVRDRELNQTIRLSIGLKGDATDHDSDAPSVSADGTTVVYHSRAKNITAHEDNFFWEDVFLYDMKAGTNQLLSITPENEIGNLSSIQPAISGDGQLVAFTTFASNFDEADTNGVPDVYIVDVPTGQLSLVSKNDDGIVGNGNSAAVMVADDASAVSFVSFADNFIDDDTNEGNDVFVCSFSSSVPGDLDGNGVVSTSDLLILLSSWGPCDDCNNCPADLNDDCTVGTSDLLILLSNWG